MSKSIKLKDNNYWDSSSITHEKETLSNFLNNKVMKFKILWTNSNPTSNFANQQIWLSDGDYDYLLINFVATSNTASSVIIKKGQSAKLHWTAYDSTGMYLYYRTMNYVSDTSYTFTDAYLSGGQRNWLCVPIEIIGIKL